MSGCPPDPAYILRGSPGTPVTCIKFTSASDESCASSLLSGTQLGDIHTWSLLTRRVTHTLPNAHNHVLSIHQTAPQSILTQGRDGCIHEWNCTGPDWVKIGTIESFPVGFCQCVPVKLGDQWTVAMPTSNQSEIGLVDLKNKEVVMSMKPKKSGDMGYGMCMAIKPVQRDNHLLVSYENGSISLWDMKCGEELSHVTLHKESVMCMDYDEEKNKGISGSVDSALITWKIQTDNQITEMQQKHVTNDGLNCIKVRPDGKLFVTGGWDNQGRLFSMKKCSPLAVLSYHTDSIQCADFSPENLIALGSKDGHISLWNLYT